MFCNVISLAALFFFPLLPKRVCVSQLCNICYQCLQCFLFCSIFNGQNLMSCNDIYLRGLYHSLLHPLYPADNGSGELTISVSHSVICDSVIASVIFTLTSA